MAWPRGFDLRSMDVFLTVADAGSMVLASKILNMTQAAVSQYISKIETELGTDLVDHSLRPIRLTPAGSLLRERVRHLLSMADEARLSVQDLGEASLPELRLAVVNSLSGALMPELYFKAHERFHFKNFSMLSGVSVDLNEALLKRDVDIIVTPDAMENINGLQRIELVSEPYILVVPKGLQAEGKSLNALARELRFIRYSTHILMGRVIKQHLRRLRITLPQSAEFDTTSAIGSMVSAGQGWTITTPLCLMEGNVSPKDVTCLPLPITPFKRSLTLVSRTGELGSRPRDLAEICSEVLRNIVSGRIASFGTWLADEFNVMDPGGVDDVNY